MRVKLIRIGKRKKCLRACSHEARYLGRQGYLGPLRYPSVHVCLCFESLYVHMKPGKLGGPRYLTWTTQLSMWTLCTGISRWARTTSTVMHMTSIRTWKSTWWKLQMPTVNTHNMQEKNPFTRESIEKTDKTKFLLNTINFHVNPGQSCLRRVRYLEVSEISHLHVNRLLVWCAK